MRISQRSKIRVSAKDKSELTRISRSKTLPHREVIRSTILLKYMENQTITSIAKDCNTNRPLVERCIDKAIAFGVMATILHVYKEVSMINDGKIKREKQLTISYDEKPGIQAIKNIAAQLQPFISYFKRNEKIFTDKTRSL